MIGKRIKVRIVNEIKKLDPSENERLERRRKYCGAILGASKNKKRPKKSCKCGDT
jgi:hypothetical protein